MAVASLDRMNENRWTKGSYIAAGFAAFIFLYELCLSIISTTLPTDGWQVTVGGVANPYQVEFRQYILDGLTPLQTGDQLLAVNGIPIRDVLDNQYAFYRMEPPNWSEGMILQYDILRAGEQISFDVPLHRASFWSYYRVITGILSSRILIQLLGSIFFFLVGLAVFILRPGNRAAHALLLIGVGFFFNSVPSNYSVPTLFFPSLPVSIPFDTWTLAINASLIYLVLAFPRPKSVLRKYPRLTPFLIYITWPLAFNTAYLFNLDNPQGYLQAAYTIYPIQIILLMVITLISLVHTALTVHDPVGLSQFKWMLVGIFSFVFVGVGGWLVSSYFFPGSMANGNWLFTVIGWFLLPVCLAIAILRYRLFDIDIIIRRTLIYGSLSLMLATVYFGSVLVLQNLFHSITGIVQSPLAIVLTTMFIAAIFQPLRSKIQNDIDKRFYRRRYDAAKAIEHFAATARQETNLEQLRDELLIVVTETMQPESVWLWFNQNAIEPHSPKITSVAKNNQ